MSGYRKVVKAAQLYLDAEKKAERAVALKALLESAKIYLAEGSNKSYGVARKDLCRDLMEVIGEYETVHNEKHGSPALLSGAEYLISGGELSDELVDQEIRIAYAQIKGNKKFFVILLLFKFKINSINVGISESNNSLVINSFEYIAGKIKLLIFCIFSK